MQHFFAFFRLCVVLLLALAGLPAHLLAQGVGIGTTAPDASAALEIVSSSKGALLPRLSETARNTMSAPAPGLIVYQTDGAQPGFWYNSGPAAIPKWVRLTDSIGVNYNPTTGLQVGPGPVTTSSGPFTVLGSSFSLSAPFSADASFKAETIYTAAELTASGAHAGQLLSITYIITGKNSTVPFSNFTVSLGHTTATATATTTTFTTGLTPVYSGTLTTTLGDNKLVFNQSPFSWDGTSNLVVQTCYGNAATGLNDFTSNLSDASNQLLFTTVSCVATTGGQYPSRPQVRFTQAGSNGYTLPPTAGATNQVLTMQANGTAIWDDPTWIRNGVHAYRPLGPGTVGLGTASTRTRFSITPSTVEPKITLWDGGGTANHYGFGVSGSQLNYHVDGNTSSHVFYAAGKNGPDTPGSVELMRLKGNGFLTVGGTGAGDTRLEIVNDGGGSGGADDMVIRSYGAAAGPGISLQRYAGSRAAPAAIQNGDFLGDIGFTGNTSSGAFFTTSSMSSVYRGDGSTFLSDLYFKTSNTLRMRIDENGLVGIGNLSPAHPLHVQGAIAANTDKGVILDAQDRPMITRGFDAFTTGNYTGLGRWGLFMELNTLTFGIPVMDSRNFQWASYNLDSSIGSVLMGLNQNGYLGVGTGTPASHIEVLNNNGSSSADDDVVIRSYGASVFPGYAIRRYRGTQAAPANLQNGDFLGEYALSAYANGAQTAFNLSGIQGYYTGNGTTALSDLRLLSSGSTRMLIDATGRVGVGTTTPAYLLDVNGVLNSTKLYLGSLPALYFGTGNSSNVWVGTRTENSIAATGSNNVSLGPSAGRALSAGVNNTIVGSSAGFALADGGYNIMVGTSAGSASVSDNFNTLVGYAAGGGLNGGSTNTMLGYAAGNNLTTGGANVALGYRAGNSLGAGMRNTLVGNAAGDDATNFDNTAVGSSAGASLSTGGRNTFLGSGADLGSTTQRTNATAIGYQAKVNQDNTIALGGTGSNAVNVGIGTTTPSQRLEVVQPTAGGYAVYGRTTSFSGADGRGVYGQSDAGEGIGYGGYFDGGYMGLRSNANAGDYIGFAYGVYANVEGSAGNRYAVRAVANVASGTTSAYGIYATASGAATSYAGYFVGNVHVNGTLSKSAGSFRIDHPQDPANKYLVHSFVESPDMLNVYNGNVMTDAQGRATVSLPSYFEAENIDFKYQLTVVGADFAQTRVAQEVQGNQFVIATDKPNVKVSWQVTGVRNDKYAQQHRLVPEEPKEGADRGKYLNPELYGRPASQGIAAPEEAREVKPSLR